jgi:hypothetical protein
MDSFPPNPNIYIGANGGPGPTPFEAIRIHIEDLYDMAVDYLDGEPIATQGQADDVSKLIRDLQEAHAAADALRIEENQPFDDGKNAVQAKYAPLIAETKKITGKTISAIAAAKKCLAPWLQKLADEQALVAAHAREEAARKAATAQAAMRAADAANLAEREAAEALVKDAQRAERAAKKAEGAKAVAGGGSAGRAIGMVTVYRAELVDPATALRHFCKVQARVVREFLQGLADAHVRFGDHTPDDLPGFKIHSEQKVR